MDTGFPHGAAVAERVISDDDLGALAPGLRPSLGPTCPCDTLLCPSAIC
jgi:hypothetical protein